MRKRFLIITSVIVVIFLFLEFIPHTHLISNVQDIEQISISTTDEKIVLNEIVDVRILGYLIQNIKLYDSDLSALPASPEKFVNINFDDGSTIKVNNMGGYSLVIHKRTDVFASTKIYRTNLFWVDFICLIANILK